MKIIPLTVSIDISAFTCGDEDSHRDLDEFLKIEALRYSAMALGYTYVAIEDGAVVGYITHLTDSIRLSYDEKNHLAQRLGFPPPHTVPALKVGRLARHASWRVRGVGTALMRHAFDKLMDVSERTGCRFLSVDAIPEAVEFYEKLGFEPNQHTTYQGKNRGTTSMRFDAFAPALPEWTK